MLIEMRLVGLAMDPFNNSPIVILKDRVSVELEAGENTKEEVLGDETTEVQTKEESRSGNTSDKLDREEQSLLEVRPEKAVQVYDEESGSLGAELDNAQLLIGEHILPIWVGEAEAHAIATVLLNLSPPRPMTHDLLKQVISLMGAKVDRVIVTDIRDNTFYASIEVKLENDEVARLDARPSDAIALALRCDADVFVDSKVLEQTKKSDKTPKLDSEQLEEFEEDKWKKMVENLSTSSTKKYSQ